jgi:Transcriptional regulator
MNTKNLHYILTLAEEKNFSKAAKRLYISQPSLSQYINNIEEETGVKLFDRSTVPLIPTYAGEKYLAAAQEILNIENRLQRELEEITGNMRGRVTIGMSLLWGRLLLPDLFPLFKNEFPNVELKVIENTRVKLMEILLEGKADLIISNQPASHQNLTNIKVFEDEILLASPYPNKNNVSPAGINNIPKMNLEDIKDEPFILLSPEQGLRKSADEIFSLYGIKPKIIFETKNVETALNLTSKGIGFTFILGSIVRYMKPDQEISCYGFDKGSYKHTMYICYRQNMYMSKPVSRLLHIIQDIFSKI